MLIHRFMLFFDAVEKLQAIVELTLTER